jgi:hypothetical protein
VNGLRQLLIEPTLERTDSESAEDMAAKLLGHRLHLAKGRIHERCLATLVALEDLGAEPALTILRNP